MKRVDYYLGVLPDERLMLEKDDIRQYWKILPYDEAIL
jgi:hypothetical protein